MSLDPTILFLGIIFSSIGVGYFIYGKKQRRPIPWIVGLLLMVYPFFFTTWVPILIVGLVLSIIPYFFRNMY